MSKWMVGSISSSTNIHGFADDNSNPYRSMVIDAMRINHSYSGEGSCNIPLYKEPNVDEAKFLKLLKDSGELLWDGCTTHSELSTIA